MKSRDDGLRNRIAAYQFVDALGHFGSGFVGKRDGHDRVRHYTHMLDQVGDAVRDHARLPAARPGQYQDRAFGGFDGFALLRVELVEKGQSGHNKGTIAEV